MFENTTEKPLILEQLEVLERRSKTNVEFIQNQLANFATGYYGEKSLEYYLKAKMFHPVRIFNNLRIPFQSQVFQMDFLLCTRHFIWLLECKNIKGNLHLDKHAGQFTRQDQGFINPIIQVEKQANLLSQFLLFHHFPPIPILTNVVIPRPSTVITADDKTLLQKFIFGYQLEEVFTRHSTKHSLSFLSSQEMNLLSQTLHSSNKELAIDWKSRFSLKKEDIRMGVQCSKCHSFSMRKRRKFWYCSVCNYQDSQAHIQALKDYSLLFGNEINASECQDWLELCSDKSARHILKTSNTEKIGNRKATVYRIHW